MFHHLGKEIMARLFKLFLLHLFFFLGASVFTSKEEVDRKREAWKGKSKVFEEGERVSPLLSAVMVKDGSNTASAVIRSPRQRQTLL